MPPALDKSRPLFSVLDLDRDVFIAQLRDLLKAKDVQSAYIVGSYARQEADPWSDVDSLIVHETDMPFIERPRIFDNLREFAIPSTSWSTPRANSPPWNMTPPASGAARNRIASRSSD